MKIKILLLVAILLTAFIVMISIDSQIHFHRFKNISSNTLVEVDGKIIKENEESSPEDIKTSESYEGENQQLEQAEFEGRYKNRKQRHNENTAISENEGPEENIDPLNVGVLNADEIEVFYNFSQLQANADNSLKLNEDTVSVLVGLFNTHSLKDIQQHFSKIQNAAAISLPIQASREFTELVESYGLFQQKILNDDTAFTNPSINIDPSASLAKKLIAYQDAYLGTETAEELFYLERAHFQLYGQLEKRYGQEIPDYELENMHMELSNLIKEHNTP